MKIKQKKLVLSAFVVVLLLVLGGFAYYKFVHKTLQTAMMGKEQGEVFGSIKDAIMNKVSLECHFTADDRTTTAAYIKNGAVRVDTNAGKTDAASMIMKDKKIYFWQVTQKTGTVVTEPSVTATPVPTSSTVKATGTQEQNEGSHALAELEKFKNACKVANIADSLFVVPIDVKFSDVSEMIKNAIPSGINQNDVEKMMQQYQNQ